MIQVGQLGEGLKFDRKVEMELGAECLRLRWVVRSWLSTCESEIERLMMLGLIVLANTDWRACSCSPGSGKAFASIANDWGTIFNQYEVCPAQTAYRLDFAIITPKQRIAIEVDGHEWHERTKEQAAHDKRRDRELVAAGWKVLRFTGSEVWRNADECVDQIAALVYPEMDQRNSAAERSYGATS